MNRPAAGGLPEAFPIPAGALVLTGCVDRLSDRSLAVAALRQALGDRRLSLPLGPETAFEDRQRLLSLNRFAVQLVTAGGLADEIEVPTAAWARADTAPQLLLAALVDADHAVVTFPGVLTGAEFVRLSAQSERRGQLLALEATALQGGLDRLFTLVQLLRPEALPRLTLPPACHGAATAAVAVIDWLRGQLDPTIAALGGELSPVAAGAFRGGGHPDVDPDALAMVVIPFGLRGDQLVSGDAARSCVRRFQLALIPTGSGRPTGLVLRLSSAVPGALLPDGLRLQAGQGSHHQSITSAMSTELALVFQASDQLLDVSLRYGQTPPVDLPSLRLPA